MHGDKLIFKLNDRTATKAKSEEGAGDSFVDLHFEARLDILNGKLYLDVETEDTPYLLASLDSNGDEKILIGYESGTIVRIAESLRMDFGTTSLEPVTDNSVDLGQADKRWKNIYSADLQLSNEGSSNDVDGTWGQYTIQEGEDDLFLLNRRNGKKYKFMLEEVN